VVEASIHYDNGGALGALVSDSVKQVLINSPGTYSSAFFVVTNLAANSYYWLVLTSPVTLRAKWATGSVQALAPYVDLTSGVMSSAIGSIPATATASDYTWTAVAAVTLATTIQGCVIGATPTVSPSPTSTAIATATASNTPPVPSASTTSLSSASTTPAAVVVLVPITANVTSTFDSTQTAFNITAPASSSKFLHIHPPTLDD
jgi:hypothetical protein